MIAMISPSALVRKLTAACAGGGWTVELSTSIATATTTAMTPAVGSSILAAPRCSAPRVRLRVRCVLPARRGPPRRAGDFAQQRVALRGREPLLDAIGVGGPQIMQRLRDPVGVHDISLSEGVWRLHPPARSRRRGPAGRVGRSPLAVVDGLGAHGRRARRQSSRVPPLPGAGSTRPRSPTAALLAGPAPTR